MSRAIAKLRHAGRAVWLQVLSLGLAVAVSFLGAVALGQTAVKVPKPEEKDKAEKAVEKQQEKKAQHTNVIEFRGQRVFDEKLLRSQLKEQIATIDDYGLTAARGDDAAFFLELFYRKHGYAKVNVRYTVAGERLILDINEGPLVSLGLVNFVGNEHQPADVLFEYAVGPTRERYSSMKSSLPFVAADVEEGADLVHRLYIANGYLDARVEKPVYHYSDDGVRVDATIPITEGRQYSFGTVNFSGQTIYGSEALHGQLSDLLEQPYTDNRVSDIPRRLQAYYRTRGYYEVKVDATGNPEAATNGRVPV
ncbi:MAG TPA: POTRA domain-containing protein, partial [Chthoniobacterales bacterium]|nr:POTRA domain-containing protein [Chthoniobacterales bacterium]